MSAQSWWDAAVNFTRENEQLIEVVLFGLGFAESLMFVSFFVPASALFLAIAALEGAAGNPVLPIVLAGAAGCFAGDITSYFMGQWLKGDVRNRWPFSRHPEWLTRTENLFEKRGVLTILIAKFIGPLRPVVPFVAGVTHMRLLPFASASLVSSLLWAAAFLLPSYYGIRLLEG